MIKVSDVVNQLVNRSPFLREAMADNLINASALARKLKPRVSAILKKEVQQGAILMAIKRLPNEAPTMKTRRLRDFLRKLTDISVRSNLVDYTFRHSDTLLNKQGVLLGIISDHPNSFYTFSRGISETTILITEDLAEPLEELFRKETLLDKRIELASISLMLPEENRSLYGVYYAILKVLAWEGINLVELISTSNEFTVIVRQEDLEDAFRVLTELRKPNPV